VDERMQGTNGSCYSLQAGNNWIKDANGKTIWKVEKKGTNPYVQEHIDLMDCIINNKKINEAAQIAYSTMTAIMGRMAEYSGKAMSWDEAYNSDERYPIYYEFRDLPKVPIPVPGGQIYTGEEGWKPG
jgi:myo-inositol 2-dehydrogenase/D-chiro-inositol 1-dehydrogenase